MNWLKEHWDKLATLILGGVVGFFSSQLAMQRQLTDFATRITKLEGGGEILQQALETRWATANGRLDSLVERSNKLNESTVPKLESDLESLENRTSNSARLLDRLAKIDEKTLTAVERLSESPNVDPVNAIAELKKELQRIDGSLTKRPTLDDLQKELQKIDGSLAKRPTFDDLQGRLEDLKTPLARSLAEIGRSWSSEKLKDEWRNKPTFEAPIPAGSSHVKELDLRIQATGRPVFVTLGGGSIGLDVGPATSRVNGGVYVRVHIMRTGPDGKKIPIYIGAFQSDSSRVIVPASGLQVVDKNPPSGDCVYSVELSTQPGMGIFYFNAGVRMSAVAL